MGGGLLENFLWVLADVSGQRFGLILNVIVLSKTTMYLRIFGVPVNT